MRTLMDIRGDSSIALNQIFPHKDISNATQYTYKVNKNGAIELKLFDNYGSLLNELPPKKNLSCTKNLINMVISTTAACWETAMKAYPRTFNELDAETTLSIKERRDLLYRRCLCKLDTDVLEAVLLCHDKKKVRRAAITLKVISDEIANRALLSDSSQTAKVLRRTK